MAPTTASSIGRSLLSLRHRSEQQVHSMDGHDSPDSDPILSFDRQASSLLLSLLPLRRRRRRRRRRLLPLRLLDRQAPPLLPPPPRRLHRPPPPPRQPTDLPSPQPPPLRLLRPLRQGPRPPQRRPRRPSTASATAPPTSTSSSPPSTAAGSTAPGNPSPTLSLLLLAEPDPALLPTRNRSFSHDPNHHHRRRQLRTALSWSVSRSWSAARQLHAMGSNLSPPKPADISGTAGLAIPIFTISSVLLFVSWVLVAAIPCQDRGLQAHLSAPRNYPWAARWRRCRRRSSKSTGRGRGRTTARAG
ncbi:uncharacterized protein M6B38_335065 [Iris pallida]|uniref:Uncharacterized protein n=1 Tax=Iris pallida TaxID=29817 RepID=A0AAX6H0S2_IRIPA|nr:uncharacterized protein M6B38_335065 [Iris pallida]